MQRTTISVGKPSILHSPRDSVNEVRAVHVELEEHELLGLSAPASEFGVNSATSERRLKELLVVERELLFEIPDVATSSRT